MKLKFVTKTFEFQVEVFRCEGCGKTEEGRVYAGCGLAAASQYGQPKESPLVLTCCVPGDWGYVANHRVCADCAAEAAGRLKCQQE